MRRLIASLLLVTACSEAEQLSFGFPGGEAQSRILVVRVPDGVRYYAIDETIEFTLFPGSAKEAQLLSLDHSLSQLGLQPGEVFSTEASDAVGFPAARAISNLDIDAERWSSVDVPWPEFEAFRFVAPEACRSFEMPVEEAEEVAVRLRGAELVESGQLLLVGSSTTWDGGSGVYLKTRGQPLQRLTYSAGARLALTSASDHYWIGGSKLWRVESLDPWSATEIATESELNNERIGALAGPLQTSTKRYDVVAYTQEGSLYAVDGDTVVKIATVRPTSHTSYGFTRQNGQLLFSGGTVSSGEVREEYLTVVDGDEITTVIVPRSVIDGGTKDQRISGIDESADGRLFVSATLIGEFLSFTPPQVRLWSGSSDPDQDSLSIIGDLAFFTMGRRSLWQIPIVEQLGPKCTTAVARFAPAGYVTFARAIEDGNDIAWVGQSTEDTGGYFTSFFWLVPQAN